MGLDNSMSHIIRPMRSQVETGSKKRSSTALPNSLPKKVESCII
ncbi:hypothetical protein AVDCRST_MAG84-7370 [uncultured Microcoleus sp.]|uniref:Uncharacterized protein n=1 Tax=uncultured Microcoleus sp. TaxID=259945 RepID=A0A6J4PSN7_9CYAN|nr:hypothetical protein AVDCRST_MAG84-7370 [uncultured Microcoleus sp.]